MMIQGSNADPRIVLFLIRASKLASGLVVALGACVLIGWVFDVQALKSVQPGLASMKPNTAVAFVALGTALLRASGAPRDPARIAAAGFVSAVGALTLVEYLIHLDLGIDQLLFRDYAGVEPAGRMAPVTAAMFLVLGLLVLAMDSRANRWALEATAFLVTFAALLSFCGYLYGAPSLYRLGPYVSIALHTTLGFLLACFAFFAARSTAGFVAVLASDTSTGAVARRLVPLVVVLPMLLGWLLLRAQAADIVDAKTGAATLVVANIATLTVAVVILATRLFRGELARGEAVAAVRASERELAITLDSIADAVIATDAQGIIVRLNPVAASLTGYAPAEATGKPLLEVFRIRNETTGELLESPVAKVLREGCVVGIANHTELLARDGSAVAIADSAAPIRAPGSERIEGVVLAFREMTDERAAARDQLFLSELGETLRAHHAWNDLVREVTKRLAKYVGAARCSFAELDEAAGRFVLHPGHEEGVPPFPETYAISAVSAETRAAHAAGRTVVVDDTEHESEAARFRGVRAFGVRAMVTVPLHREGTWVAVLSVSVARPRKWTEREVALIQIAAERTWLWVEHLRILDALRASEARKAAKLNSAFDGIVSVDHQGKIIEFNPAAERLFGRARSDVLGQSMSDLLIPPALREMHRAGFARYLSGGEGPVLGKTVEFPALRADGAEFPAELAITRVQGQEPPLFTAFIRDVSERKKSEHERAQLLTQLKEANAELEQRVAARTAELTATLQEREVLLQEIHHRVKNNLQVISSLINMQLRQMADLSGRTALEECRNRVAAIALIHEKLYQSRDYARVPFSEYASSLASSIFQALSVSPGNVTLSVDTQAMWLAVDRAIPCALILNELITNALKHAFPGQRPGGVWITLEKALPNVVTLSVRDDGVGIPSDFNPETSTSLGMQLISVLVEQLEGRLEIVRDHGTAFRISFPEAVS